MRSQSNLSFWGDTLKIGARLARGRGILSYSVAYLCLSIIGVTSGEHICSLSSWPVQHGRLGHLSCLSY